MQQELGENWGKPEAVAKKCSPDSFCNRACGRVGPISFVSKRAWLDNAVHIHCNLSLLYI